MPDDCVMMAMHMSAPRAFKRRSWWRVAAAARIRGRGRALPMHGYPPACLADLCVQLLAQSPENEFTADMALGGAARTDTRSAATDTPCCIVHSRSTLGAMFYIGIDRRGYILINQRLNLHGWPTARGGRSLPLRLARWLTQAGGGVVVRHACDNPSCIRLSHLIIGTQGDNLADARRRRRRPARLRAAADCGPTTPSPSATALACGHRGTAAAAANPTTGAAGACSTASPSKLARKRARQQLAASLAADSGVPPLRLV